MSVRIVYTCDSCLTAVSIEPAGVRQTIDLQAPELDGWLHPPASRAAVLCPCCRDGQPSKPPDVTAGERTVEAILNTPGWQADPMGPCGARPMNRRRQAERLARAAREAG